MAASHWKGIIDLQRIWLTIIYYHIRIGRTINAAAHLLW
jgi:hypothetical protein